MSLFVSLSHKCVWTFPIGICTNIPPAAQNNRCVHFILEPQGRNIIVRNINDENSHAWLLLASNVVTRSQNIIYCRVWTIIHLFKLAPGIIVTAVGLVDWSEGRYPFPRTGFGRGRVQYMHEWFSSQDREADAHPHRKLSWCTLEIRAFVKGLKSLSLPTYVWNLTCLQWLRT